MNQITPINFTDPEFDRLTIRDSIGGITGPLPLRAHPQWEMDAATAGWVAKLVNEQVCSGINSLLISQPFVWAFNGRSGSIWLTLDDIERTFFTAGNQVTAPTPPATADGDQLVTAEWVRSYIAGESTIALQAWVTQQIAAAIANTVTSFNGRQGVVTLTLNDVTSVGGAPLNSPDFSGVPTAPTANTGTSTAQIATTAFVMAAITSAVTGVVSFNDRTGAVTLEAQDILDAGGALLASPAFTGVPVAPTAAPGTSTMQLATTAFVTSAINTVTANSVTSFNGRQGAVTLTLTDVTNVGGAPIASPNFTGTPTAPTAAAGTSTTQLATTAFVTQAIATLAAGTVASFNGRTGAITLTANDVSAAGGLVNPSPALTGTPTAPTAVPGTSTTQIATTAFVTAAITGIAGNYLPVSGGVSMTGQFNLSADATQPMQPTTLEQMQAAIAVAPYVPQNVVDNSGFTVIQRGYSSGTALAAGAYGIDRWKGGPAAGCTLTFASTAASTIVTITAGSVQQVIEAPNMLSAPYTLSWFGTAQGRISTTSGGGIYAASPVSFSGTANTVTYIEFTGGTLGQVQLQLGNVATPWQPQNFGIEIERCQRFYQGNMQVVYQSGGATPSATGNGFGQTVMHSTRMRAAPSVTIISTSGSFGLTSMGASNVGVFGLTLGGISSGGIMGLTIIYSLSADL